MANKLFTAIILCFVVYLGVEACSHNYNFDYFLLATQWPESFCETAKCAPHQDRWAIHGAWPENNDGTWPQDCCTKQPYNHASIKSIESQLVAAWSTLKANGNNDQFWSHEYMKHGTCAIQSPLMKDELNYFNNTLTAFHKLQIHKWLEAANIVPSESKTYQLSTFHSAIKKGLGHNVEIDCVKTKHHKFPVISQINFCLSKQTLEPFDCTLKDRGCKQSSIGYLPSK